MEQEEIIIDLNCVKNGQLNEFSYLRHLGAKIELMIKLMFGPRGLSSLAGRVSGTRSQVNTFLKALKGEKKVCRRIYQAWLDRQKNSFQQI